MKTTGGGGVHLCVEGPHLFLCLVMLCFTTTRDPTCLECFSQYSFWIHTADMLCVLPDAQHSGFLCLLKVYKIHLCQPEDGLT